MPARMSVDHFVLDFDECVLRIHNMLDNTTVCLRPTELESLVRLIDGVSCERRHAMRVPVTDNELRVVLGISASLFQVQVIDVSTGGIRVVWARDDSPAIDVNEQALINITYGSGSVTGVGIVRRIDRESLAISFPDEGTIDNTALRNLLAAFESEWLEKRLAGQHLKSESST